MYLFYHCSHSDKARPHNLTKNETSEGTSVDDLPYADYDNNTEYTMAVETLTDQRMSGLPGEVLHTI